MSFPKHALNTNLEEEETANAPGNDGNASMPVQVKRPNHWRKMMTVMLWLVTTNLNIQTHVYFIGLQYVYNIFVSILDPMIRLYKRPVQS